MNQLQTHEHKRSDSRAARFARLILAWLIFAIVFTVLPVLFAESGATDAAMQKLQPSSGATLVCVISRYDSSDASAPGNMDALVLVVNGKLRQPYPEYNEAAQQQFGKEYFAAGKKYRMTFGGGTVGTATVKSFDTGCNNIHAKADIEDDGKVPAHLSALATTSDSLGRKLGSRRAPTDAERAATMKLVTQIYRSRGTTPAWLRLLKTTNMTATDLNGDGKLEIIASFVIETKAKTRKDLLLIAEPDSAGFKPALVKFQSYKLPPEGFDSAIDFVDQLDIDGDGVGEVFVQQHGFDAYGYAIYKKSGGRWREVYTTTGDAC